jgi:hypothetical protein
MVYSSWKYLPCADCGTSVLTRQCGGHDVLCKGCREERRRKKDELYNETRKRGSGEYRSIDKFAYLVEYDPDPIGGYPKGALINLECMQYMLLQAYMAFTVGTILKNMAGDRFEVCAKKKGGLRLKPLTLSVEHE